MSTPVPSLRAINAILPRKLLELDNRRALASLLGSLALPIGLICAAFFLAPQPRWNDPLTLPIWIAFSTLLGTIEGGLWVIGHECGHGSFLRPRWLEQFIGFTLHSFFLSPYFAWRRTHQLHHLWTNHCAEDIAYVPYDEDSFAARMYRSLQASFGKIIPNALLHMIVFTVGFPFYLLFGMHGRLAGVSHFLPFNRKVYPSTGLRLLVAGNTLVYGLWLAILVSVTLKNPGWMLFLYWLPLLVVNFWLLFYTLLHHSHLDVPWYGPESWTASKAAFATIDRAYWGWINRLHYNIGRFHVYHHVNSRIPYYNGEAATAILQENYPELYRFDPTNPFLSSWTIGKTGLAAVKSKIGEYRYTLPDSRPKTLLAHKKTSMS